MSSTKSSGLGCIGVFFGILPVIGAVIASIILISRKKYQLLIIPGICLVLTFWMWVYKESANDKRDKLKNQIENTIFSISFTTTELLKRSEFEEKLKQHLSDNIDFNSLIMDEKEKFAFFLNSLMNVYETQWEKNKDTHIENFTLPLTERTRFKKQTNEFCDIYIKQHSSNSVLENLFSAIFALSVFIMIPFSAYVFSKYGSK